MPNDPELTYAISWRTCRNKPIIQKETKRLFFRLISEIASQNDLEIEDKWVLEDGRLVGVRVSTRDPEFSPNSIAYLLRHKTGGLIRRSNPAFQKLPAIWTSQYDISTVGRYQNE